MREPMEGEDWISVEQYDRLCVENDLLVAENQAMREALQGLFEHCAMIHKHWGEGSNLKEANEAIAKAEALATGKEQV
jgi:hypothetical protein